MKFLLSIGYSAFFIGVFSLTHTAVQAYEKGWAERTFESMTLDQKIGQLFVVTAISDSDLLHPGFKDFFKTAAQYAGLDCEWHEYGGKASIEELIKNYHIGGVIYLGRGRSLSQVKLTNHFQSMSKHPLFIAQDYEWGLSPRMKEVIHFPSMMTLGALIDDKPIYEFGREVGEQCKAIGVNVNFAPVVDVNSNYKNPVIHMRSFGDDKEKVATKALRYMKGMQDVGVIACAKHFPGHGDTHLDSHHDLPRIDKTVQELEEMELYPFKKMIEGGVDSIMTAHLELPALEPEPNTPSSLSRSIVTDLLREKMEFNGLIFTDALIMDGVTKFNKPGDIEMKALKAGNDVLLCPTNVHLAITAIKDALQDGCLSFQELDAHVMRILKAKEKIASNNGFKVIDEEEARERLNKPSAHDLSKSLFEQAVTLCGSESDLPEPSTEFGLIEVYPPKDNNFSEAVLDHCKITKGWTIPGPMSDENKVQTLDYFEKMDTIVIAIFRIEWRDPANYGIDTKVIELINELKDAGKKVIMILFGTPYSLRLFDKNDTIIMAYEDDPAAHRAAAEVLYRKRKAIGILPVADMRYITS